MQIVFIVVWILFTLTIPHKLRQRGKKESQLIATTLGVLGTFIGIAWGLLFFDATNISESVPSMLDGLRLAFLTSIAGMSYSLAIGIFADKMGYPEEAEAEEVAKTSEALLEGILDEIKNLNSNIAGDDDTTIITQMQKLRISVNDKQDLLKNGFDEFAKQMAENNTKALIKAVSLVMEDFNAKINDQLGDSFKLLSDATERLVEWQAQYKEQIVLSTEALKKSEDSLKISAGAVSSFAEDAKSFQKVAFELKESLEVMGSSMTGLKKLSETLDASGQIIRDEMSELTKQNIKELGANLKGISEKLVEDYSHLQSMMKAVPTSDKGA